MATEYQITITMPDNTVTALTENGFSLYALLAVQSSAEGSPVVWYRTNDFALATAISWSDNYQAYTSRSPIIQSGTITAGAAYPATVGQTLSITNPMAIGEVSQSTGTGPELSGITFINQTSTQFTCGITLQQPTGSFGPICAFPLFGNNMDIIVPTQRVFLMFSSLAVPTGSVIEQAYGPGILIDMTGVTTQTVSYDINLGWSWAGGASWAQAYPPNQNLAPLLVRPGAAPGSPLSTQPARRTHA